MTDKQKIAFWAGLIIIQLMIIFPPIGQPQATSENIDGSSNTSIISGWIENYGLIIRDYKNINFGLLAIQIGIVAIITGCFMYALRDKDKQETGH
jgi:hypothetical protein